MRLISQNGMIDVPYEISALSIGRMRESASIYVRSRLLDERPCVFATYSNTDKALKVMEMLREEYLRHIYGSGGEMVTRDLYIPPFAFIPPKVFKFPADEEVEV